MKQISATLNFLPPFSRISENMIVYREIWREMELIDGRNSSLHCLVDCGTVDIYPVTIDKGVLFS